MFNFFDEVLFAKNVSDKREIVGALLSNKVVVECYLVCVPHDSRSFLEVFSSAEMHRRYTSKKMYTVVGVALGKYSAVRLIPHVFQKFLSKGQAISDFKKYFLR